MLLTTAWATMGAFRPSLVALSGYVSKVPWRLNATRRANQRKRLKLVEENVAALKSVCDIKALSNFKKFEGPERYFKVVPPTPYNKVGRKGVHKTPHFTKLPRDYEDIHNKG